MMARSEGAEVTVLKLGTSLIASIQAELTDTGWACLRDDLLEAAGDTKVSGALIDVSAMSVMDSYAGRMLSSLAQMLKLRGVDIVVVGIQPAVALAMVQLGLDLGEVSTALDLDAGARLLANRAEERANG